MAVLLSFRQDQVARGASQTGLDTWLAASSMCLEWAGVTCHSNGRLRTLDLRIQGLRTAALPQAFSSLDQLTSLDLGLNSFSGSLPPAWSRLTSLVDINLAFNALSGPLPAQWSTLSRMATMDLAGNSLTGSIPSEWAALTGVRSMELDNNCLVGPVPPAITFISVAPRQSSTCLAPPPPPVGVQRVTVAPLAIEVAEGGVTASYNLTSPGPYPVEVDVILGEGVASQVITAPAGKAFIRDAAGATVVVEAVDDALVEGTHLVVIRHAAPAASSLQIDSVSVTIEDNDVGNAGIVLHSDTPNVQVVEGGAAELRVSLAAAADQPVTIAVEVKFLDGAGVSKLAPVAEPSLLTFDAFNSATPRAVTVSTKSDGVATGDLDLLVSFTATSLTDAYDAIRAVRVIRMLDSDTAGVVLQPSSVRLKEGGNPAEVTVALSAQPLRPLTLTWADASGRLAVSPTSATIVPGQSGAAPSATFRVSALRDGIAQGESQLSLALAMSAPDGSAFSAVTVPSLAVSVLDGDTAGVRIDIPDEVMEGARAELLAAVSTRLVVDVTVDLALDGQRLGSLRFTDQDWAEGAPVWLPLSFTVPVDGLATGTRSLTLSTTVNSDDAAYADLGESSAAVVRVIDADAPGMCLGSPATCPTRPGALPMPLEATEGAEPVVVEIVLATPPLADVLLTLVVADEKQLEVVASQASIPAGATKPSAIFHVRAVDDQTPEGGRHSTALCVSSTSGDPAYNELTTCSDVDIIDSVLVDVAVEMGPAGGRVATFRGFNLTFPDGALPSEAIVRVKQVTPEALADVNCLPDPVRFTLLAAYILTAELIDDGSQADFDADVTMSWPMPSGGHRFDTLQLITAPGDDGCGGWRVSPGLALGDRPDSLVSRVSHFSAWALAQVHPVASIDVVGPGEGLAYVEDGPPVALAASGRLALRVKPGWEGVRYVSAVAALLGDDFDPSADELLLEDVPGFNASWGASRGELVVAATSPALVTAIELEVALGAVRFRSLQQAAAPDASRDVVLTLVDEHTVSEPMPWTTVALQNVPDPPTVSTSTSVARCVERGGAIALDQGLSLADVDSASLRRALVWLEPATAGDALRPPAELDAPGLTASVEDGLWTLSGVASVAVYQRTLQRFTLRNEGPRVDVDGAFSRVVWFAVEDTSGMGAAGSRTIEMVPTNDAPVMAQRTVSLALQEEGTLHSQLTASDPDGDAVTFSVACLPRMGQVELSPNGSFTYTGNPDRYGLDVFLMQVEDADGAVDIATVSVMIENTPDPPRAQSSRVEAVWLGETTPFSVDASDPDGDAIWVYVTREPAKGRLALAGEAPTQAGSSRRKGRNPLSFAAPAAEDGGPPEEEVTFEFVAVDEAASPPQASAPAVVTLVLRNAAAVDNGPPEARPVAITTTEGRAVSGAFDASDDTSRPEQLSYRVVLEPELGGVQVDVSGSAAFTYTPRSGVFGEDRFLYVAVDRFLAESPPAVVTISVVEVNDPPSAACNPAGGALLANSSALQTWLDSAAAARHLARLGGLGERNASQPDDDPSLAELLAGEMAGAESGRQLMGLQALADTLLAAGGADDYAVACAPAAELAAPMGIEAGSGGVDVLLLAYDADERSAAGLTIIMGSPGSSSIGGSLEQLPRLNASATQGSGLSALPFRYAPPPLRWGRPLETVAWAAVDSGGLVSKTFKLAFAVDCSPGYAAEAGGRCSPCVPGTFNLPGVAGQEQCLPCPPGSHSPDAAATACAPCPPDTFQAAAGQAACEPCPDAAMRAQPGAESAAECECDYGRFVMPIPGSISVSCAACPPGTVCDELHQALPKPAAPGLWVDPAGSGTVLACQPPESCVFHRTVADVASGACAPGYAGAGCLTCEAGSYRTNSGACASCSRFTWALYVLAAFALLALIPVINKLSNLQSFGSINILVTAVQVNAVLMQLNLDWPPFIRGYFQLTSPFALKFDVMSPECIATDWHYLNKLIAVDALPVLMLPAMVAYYYGGLYLGFIHPPASHAVRNVSVFEAVSKTWSGYSAPFLLLLSWGYYTLMDVNVEYFNCSRNNGRYFMVVEPSIECWDFSRPLNRHAILLPIAATSLLAYGIGIPALFATILFRRRCVLERAPALRAVWLYELQRYEMSEEQYVAVLRCGAAAPRRLVELQDRCGFLFRRYAPAAFWWELVVLARKLVLVLVRQISSPLEQCWLMVVLLLGYIAAVMRVQPYESSLLVRMDTVAMCLSLLTVITGFIFYSDTMPDLDATAIGGYLVLIMLILNLAVLIVYVALDSVPGLMKLARLQRLQRSQILMEAWREAWGLGARSGSTSRLAALRRISRLCCGRLVRRDISRRRRHWLGDLTRGGGQGQPSPMNEDTGPVALKAPSQASMTLPGSPDDVTAFHGSGAGTGEPASLSAQSDPIRDMLPPGQVIDSSSSSSSSSSREGQLSSTHLLASVSDAGCSFYGEDASEDDNSTSVTTASPSRRQLRASTAADEGEASAAGHQRSRRTANVAPQAAHNTWVIEPEQLPPDSGVTRRRSSALSLAPSENSKAEIGGAKPVVMFSAAEADPRLIGDGTGTAVHSAGPEITALRSRHAKHVMEHRAPVDARKSWKMVRRKTHTVVRVTDEQKDVLRLLRIVLAPELYSRARDMVIGCKDSAVVQELHFCASRLFDSLHVVQGSSRTTAEEERRLLVEAVEAASSLSWWQRVAAWWSDFISEPGHVEGKAYRSREEQHTANYRESCAAAQYVPELHGLLTEALVIRALEWAAFDPANNQRRLLQAVLCEYQAHLEAHEVMKDELYDSDDSDSLDGPYEDNPSRASSSRRAAEADERGAHAQGDNPTIGDTLLRALSEARPEDPLIDMEAMDSPTGGCQPTATLQ